jgi:hypothetical protein
MTSIVIYSILALTIINIVLLFALFKILMKHSEFLIQSLDENLTEVLIKLVDDFKMNMGGSMEGINPIQMAIGQLIQNMADRPPKLEAEVITRDSDGKFK